MDWKPVLKLDSERKIIDGSEVDLANAIGRGADLRIYCEFHHNEHVDTNSDNPELVREASEFAITYLLHNAWSAGIMNLRQPISIPHGFGPPSMSFFMYNQNGQQAIARPYLDGVPKNAELSLSPAAPPLDMPKMHPQKHWDDGTNAPSGNFIYDFDVYSFFVSDGWQCVLEHDTEGNVLTGSVDDLDVAFTRGCDIKVGIRNFGAPLLKDESNDMEHEVFVKTGWGFYYSDQALFMAGSHPVVRVKPSIPMNYESRGWDFGWLFLRSDGYSVYRRCDPYTLSFEDIKGHHAVRWFIR